MTPTNNAEMATAGHAGSAKSKAEIEAKLYKLRTCRDKAVMAGSLGVALLHYEEFVRSSSSPTGDVLMANTEADQRLLAAMGCSSKSGELLDQFKKAIFHKGQREVMFDPAREANILKEAGDIFWYFTLFLSVSGIDLKTVLFNNMDKLIGRQEENLRGADNV